MDAPKPTNEEKYRSSLEDLIAVCDRMSAYCRTPEEMVEVLRLAITNDAQLKIVMAAVSRK